MRMLVLAALIAVPACKKTDPPARERPPEAAASLPMRAAGRAEKPGVSEQMTKLDAIISADQRLAELNRRLMVSPAPADFRAEPVARKIRLNLVLERTRLRVGESPRFRLELTNVGQEPINYVEYDSSVFRWGGLFHSIKTIKFMLTDKNGKRRRLQPSLALGRAQPFTPHNGPPSAETEAESKASTTFQVKLLPGETLRSFGDGDTTADPFRTMLDRDGFKVPGRFQIHVELNDTPRPLTDSYITFASKFQSSEMTRKDHAQRVADALGPVSSNAVILDITR